MKNSMYNLILAFLHFRAEIFFWQRLLWISVDVIVSMAHSVRKALKLQTCLAHIPSLKSFSLVIAAGALMVRFFFMCFATFLTAKMQRTLKRSETICVSMG